MLQQPLKPKEGVESEPNMTALDAKALRREAPEAGTGASTHMGETATRQILHALESAGRQLGEETTVEVPSIRDILGQEAAETAQEALDDQWQQEMLSKKVVEAELRRLRAHEEPEKKAA